MMKKFLSMLPLPICGLILGLVSLGNLLKSIGFDVIGMIIGMIGITGMLLIVMKLIFLFKPTVLLLKDPIVGSVAPTFSMSLMVICTYLAAYPPLASLASYLWLTAIGIHVGLVAYFTYIHVIKTQITMTSIYPSWFILYVGFGIITVTGNMFYPAIGQFFFWVALCGYVLLLPVILRRILFTKHLPTATLPLLTIVAAPGSLCLTGYLKGFQHPNLGLVMVLLAVSQALYFFILLCLPTLLKLPFFPSYGAFTFPLVISATAIGTGNQFLTALEHPSRGLSVLANMECGIALMMVGYVLIRYVAFLVADYRRRCKIAKEDSTCV